MRHQFVSLLALTSVLAAAPVVAAQDVITIDVTSVVADVSRKPIGINVNFLLDDDANRTNAVEGLTQALRKAGVKYLRYPGGEKSDGYLWSIPPYTSSVPTLARWAAGEYPESRMAFVRSHSRRVGWTHVQARPARLRRIHDGLQGDWLRADDRGLL